MKKLYVLFQIFIFIFVSCFSSQNKNNDIVQEKIDMADIQPSRNICKPLTNANPISSNELVGGVNLVSATNNTKSIGSAINFFICADIFSKNILRVY